MNLKLKKYCRLSRVFVLLILVNTNFFAQSKSNDLIKQTFYITVEDSIKLGTNIYFPKGASVDDGKKYSTILVRDPYGINGIGEDVIKQVKALLKNEWVVILQDTRGKFLSDGVYHPFIHERSDGVATTKWIRSQPWSNGKIAGWGGSYVGYTQWAIGDELDVLTPVITTSNIYEAIYPEGIYSLAGSFNWGLPTGAKTYNVVDDDKLRKSYYILPLSVADDSTVKQIDFLDCWLQHPNYDTYWGVMNHRNTVTKPVYSIAGWYDIFLMGQIHDFEALGTSRHPDSRLVIGPYAHGEITIETNYGEDGNLEIFHKDMIDFIKKHFEDGEKEYTSKPYSLYVINRKEWIDCEQWPPKNSKLTPYYLNANGKISDQSEVSETILGYTYDPIDPYLSLGGTFLGVGVGPAYQNSNINRKDQIVFESETLKEPLTLLGEIYATVYASTDASSTDFFVQLQEIRKDGKIINIQEGGKTIYSEKRVKPFPEKVDISVWATGYQIEAGNKIRVVISSSLFPRYNRNLNSGESIYNAKTPRVANQYIYLGGKYPTHITLPLLDINN